MPRILAWIRRRPLLTAGLGVSVLLVAYLGYNGVRTWVAWRSIDRIVFDLASSREFLDGRPGDFPTAIPVLAVDPALDRRLDTYLVIGTDADKNLLPQYEGNPEAVFGDAIMLYVSPEDGPPALVSLPRDLLVTDPCTGSVAKLSGMLVGCEGDVSGPELLAIAVEDFTGIGVDHFGVISFSGFVGVIDGLGGIELCLPYPLGELEREIIPAGCSTVLGDAALRYVRSRQTQQLIDGVWHFEEAASDLTRVQRQQEVLFAALARVKQLRSPAALADVVSGLSDGALILDENLSMGKAISVAWELRGTPADTIRRVVLPVEPTLTPDGRFAVRATADLLEILALDR